MAQSCHAVADNGIVPASGGGGEWKGYAGSDAPDATDDAAGAETSEAGAEDSERREMDDVRDERSEDRIDEREEARPGEGERGPRPRSLDGGGGENTALGLVTGVTGADPPPLVSNCEMIGETPM